MNSTLVNQLTKLRFIFLSFSSEPPPRGFTCPFSPKRFAIAIRRGRSIKTNPGAKWKEEVNYVIADRRTYHIVSKACLFSHFIKPAIGTVH